MQSTNPLPHTRAMGLTNTTLGMADGREVTMGAYTNFLPVGTEAILT
jgi:hypothetical protein